MAAIASKIDALVATALQEAQTTTPDNFPAFLAKIKDIDMLINEFKTTMTSVNTTAAKVEKSKKSSESEHVADSDDNETHNM